MNILVSSFRFIWIPMLWVHGHYKYVLSFSAEIDFRRQNLTSTDIRFWRLKSRRQILTPKIDPRAVRVNICQNTRPYTANLQIDMSWIIRKQPLCVQIDYVHIHIVRHAQAHVHTGIVRHTYSHLSKDCNWKTRLIFWQKLYGFNTFNSY